MLGGRSNLWESELEVFRIRFPTSADKIVIAAEPDGGTPLFYNACSSLEKGKANLETVKGGDNREIKDGLHDIPNKMGKN